jgi:O-antigen ligase
VVLYRRAIVAATVFLFYGNVVLWAFASGKSPLPPLPFIVLLVVATLPLVFVQDEFATLFTIPFFWWVGVYVALIVWWFLWAPATVDTFQILRTRLVGVVFVVSALMILVNSKTSADARRLVAVFVLFATALNVYEFFNLGAFSSVLGRAAGLYINPNISGSSILAGMIVGLGVIPQRWRSPFILTALLGIALTFSRGALLCATAVLIILCVKNVVSVRSLIVSLAVFVLGVMAALGVTRQSGKLVAAYELSATQWIRLGIGSGPLAEGDELSNSLRREVAERSWEAFLQRPITGEGTGATGDTTHNMYLMFAAEHGIIGLLLFPLLPLSLLATHDARRSPETWAFASFILFWGLFSHNVLEEFPLLFCIALASQPLTISADDPSPDAGEHIQAR